MMRNLINAALSMVIQRYMQSKPQEAEHKLQRLQRVLIRVDALVEEAEGRDITSQAMLRQLELLRQGMYGGHYMLDTFRCKDHGDNNDVSDGRVVVSRPQFRAAKRLLLSPDNEYEDNLQNIMLDADSVRSPEKVLHGLEKLMADMQEFVVLLGGYPRICRQPYSTYLILDKVMFGRQMEMETVLNFLLVPDAAGDGNPEVLPIVGAPRVGKSTLVEHVCLDERVRSHFRLIVFFSSNDIGAGSIHDLRESAVIKHQDLCSASQGKSLAVIQLTGDMQEETWRRLYSSAASSMGHGTKIIVTSRSENIVAFGTTQALRLKPLSQEAFWYFFKTLAFGSTSPDDEPKLKTLGIEIAMLLNRHIIRAHIVACLLRTNHNARFWRRLLQCLRDYTSKHFCTYGEHPPVLISKSKPVYLWSMVRNQTDVVISNVYRKPSPYDGVPKLRVEEFITEGVTDRENFDMVMWRSSIPPYNTYVVSCMAEPTKCSKANKKRPRRTESDMNCHGSIYGHQCCRLYRVASRI